MLKTVAFAGLASITTTILVDSYFWQQWIWPEAKVFYFNIIQNQSSNWGVDMPNGGM